MPETDRPFKLIAGSPDAIGKDTRQFTPYMHQLSMVAVPSLVKDFYLI